MKLIYHDVAYVVAQFFEYEGAVARLHLAQHTACVGQEEAVFLAVELQYAVVDDIDELQLVEVAQYEVTRVDGVYLAGAQFLCVVEVGHQGMGCCLVFV